MASLSVAPHIIAEEDILDIAGSQCLLKRLAIELRIATAIGHRPHITESNCLALFD
jgi:hypothetical protein